MIDYLIIESDHNFYAITNFKVVWDSVAGGKEMEMGH